MSYGIFLAVIIGFFIPLAASPTVAYLVTHHIINGILLKKYSSQDAK